MRLAPAYRVCVICSGNVCGPPMARTVRTPKDRGYDGTDHRARELRAQWFSDRDLILGADRGRAQLSRRAEPTDTRT